jgi:hypothetical protein
VARHYPCQQAGKLPGVPARQERKTAAQTSRALTVPTVTHRGLDDPALEVTCNPGRSSRGRTPVAFHEPTAMPSAALTHDHAHAPCQYPDLVWPPPGRAHRDASAPRPTAQLRKVRSGSAAWRVLCPRAIAARIELGRQGFRPHTRRMRGPQADRADVLLQAVTPEPFSWPASPRRVANHVLGKAQSAWIQWPVEHHTSSWSFAASERQWPSPSPACS